MEQILQWMIYTHAALGGIALLAGSMSLAVKKGTVLHKKAGKVFYYSMLASILISFLVAMMPGHENAFLIAIGVFSSYFLISGYRSLRFKNNTEQVGLDQLIAIVVSIVGVLMICLPIVLQGAINIILFVFGLVSIAFGIRDYYLLQKPVKLKQKWLKLHLGKMTGAFIAAITAFFVVNNMLPNIYNWFVPSIFGVLYITYWSRKIG